MSALHLLRPGTVTDMNGQTVRFTASDLSDIARRYSPERHEAPLVVGHPKLDAPAYGWVQSLRADKTGLHAIPHQVDSQFAELVREGKYKKLSVSLYPPKHPNNPSDSWYLKHVGFLGAQAPAVKGLAPADLAEDDEATVIEVACSDAVMLAQSSLVGRLLRNLREFLIDSRDIDTAEKVLPAWAIADLEAEPDTSVAYSDSKSPDTHLPTTGGHIMPDDKTTDTKTTDLAEAKAALDEQEAALKAKALELTERETRLQKQQLEAMLDGHIEAGRVLPADRGALISLCECLGAGDLTLEFADGDGQQVKTGSLTWFDEWLGRLPVQVDFSEQSAADDSKRLPPLPCRLAMRWIRRGLSYTAKRWSMPSNMTVITPRL